MDWLPTLVPPNPHAGATAIDDLLEGQVAPPEAFLRGTNSEVHERLGVAERVLGWTGVTRPSEPLETTRAVNTLRRTGFMHVELMLRHVWEYPDGTIEPEFGVTAIRDASQGLTPRRGCVLYRGAPGGRERGLFWTPDIHAAARFARTLHGTLDVWMAIVPASRVLAVFCPVMPRSWEPSSPPEIAVDLAGIAITQLPEVPVVQEATDGQSIVNVRTRENAWPLASQLPWRWN